jgi:uncharacterized protein YkwD
MRREFSVTNNAITMKSIIAFVIVTFLISCQTSKDYVPSTGAKSTALPVQQEARVIEPERDAKDWDLSALDTARGVNYLTTEERNVILELNKVRTNPKKYANQYLVPSLKYYQGKQLTYPGKTAIMTEEGRAAVEECIRVLSSTRPVRPLLPSKALSLAAKAHVSDTGPKGIVGHTGSDGSSALVRIQRRDNTLRAVAETISYGKNEARRIIESLIVDDGVSSRGHRRIILTPEYDVVGPSIGSHKGYRNVCVIDYGNAP